MLLRTKDGQWGGSILVHVSK